MSDAQVERAMAMLREQRGMIKGKMPSISKDELWEAISKETIDLAD